MGRFSQVPRLEAPPARGRAGRVRCSPRSPAIGFAGGAQRELPLLRLYLIRGRSMEPSYRSGDLLLVGPVGRGAPARGDVVVLRDPREPDAHDLKRVVGLPGESVRLADGSLYVDGAHLAEPYLGGLPASLGLERREWTLPGDRFFVLSDNRARGIDSRDFGPVRRAAILGKVWRRVWPPRGPGRAGR